MKQITFIFLLCLFSLSLFSEEQSIGPYEKFDTFIRSHEAIKLNFKGTVKLPFFGLSKKGSLVLDKEGNFILRLHFHEKSEYALKLFEGVFVEYRKIDGDEKYASYRNIEKQPVAPFVKAINLLHKNSLEAVQSLAGKYRVRKENSSLNLKALNADETIQNINLLLSGKKKALSIVAKMGRFGVKQRIRLQIEEVVEMAHFPISEFLIPVKPKTRVAIFD